MKCPYSWHARRPKSLELSGPDESPNESVTVEYIEVLGKFYFFGRSPELGTGAIFSGNIYVFVGS